MLSNHELSNYYDTYWQQYEIDKLFPLLIAQAKSRFKFIEPFLPPMERIEVLDVGSGYGHISNSFSRYYQESNYDVIEVDNQAITYLRNNIHPRYIFSNIEECNNIYNLVIASHILEHYNDFSTILRDISQILETSGLIMIEVPNKDFMFKPSNEPHVIFFSLENLRQLLEKYNYTIVRIDSCGELLSTLVDRNMTAPKKGRQNILSKVSLASIRSFLKKFAVSRETYEYVDQYGGERQWLRVLAQKSPKQGDDRA
jgi:SAM-dependent methyltransferase